MAIQNFLSGGYYGKLGQTIGQRWKNKRTVKAYAVPTNPRTAKQQANRGRFAYGVKLAQLAQAATYRSLLFSSESNTEWALRMSVAKNATDTGITGLDAVPLCPTGFVPKYLIMQDASDGSVGYDEVICTNSISFANDREWICIKNNTAIASYIALNAKNRLMYTVEEKLSQE